MKCQSGLTRVSNRRETWCLKLPRHSQLWMEAQNEMPYRGLRWYRIVAAILRRLRPGIHKLSINQLKLPTWNNPLCLQGSRLPLILQTSKICIPPQLAHGIKLYIIRKITIPPRFYVKPKCGILEIYCGNLPLNNLLLREWCHSGYTCPTISHIN